MKIRKQSFFSKLRDWIKEKKEERILDKKYKERLKEIKKRDPYTYD